MNNDKLVLIHHLIRGGKIKDLMEQFNIPSTSTVHKILDGAKKGGIYDWSKNKNRELTEDVIETYGEDIINFILSLDRTPKISESVLSKPKKVIALPDIHYPHHINLSAIEKFIADYKPDVIIYLGDLLDLDYLSKYQKDNKLVIGNNLKQEYEEVIRLIERHRQLAKASEVYYIEGNHEARVRKFLESYPAGTGFIEIPNAMQLKERGIEWVDLNDFVRVGQLFYTHGLYFNTYHAKKHVEMCSRNVIYGHTHTRQFHSGYHPFDKDIPYVAESIGCLCNLNPPYRKNLPSQWVNSFNYSEVETDGNFWGNTITLIKGCFRATGLTSKRYEI